MQSSERQLALRRTQALFGRTEEVQDKSDIQRSLQDAPRTVPGGGVQLLLFQANLAVSAPTLFGISLLLGLLAGLLCSPFVPLVFSVLVAAAVCYIPTAWVRKKAQERAAVFSTDFPTVLLATASSIKAGLSPYVALERSVKLLPRKSLVKIEVQRLISELRRGIPKEDALARFACNIQLPDLALFRAAFLLVLENGGKFAPTLQRLAQVSRDREALIRSSRVSTATMRMTANVLLVMTPLILIMISARTGNFFEILLNNPTANNVASFGAMMILVSYGILKHMSNFRP